jgi:PTH1 family peptidyl-tRNA hydrolase
VKLLVGLGNPGRHYAETRHNVGWWVLDHLADVWRCEGWRRNLKGDVTRGRVGAEDVRLLKPTTYMNLSGQALTPYLRVEGFDPSKDLLVVVDEVALPVGRIRLRARGSAGGHNGLKSVEAAVGSRDYPRLRIGVGPPADRTRTSTLSDYVLDRMGKQEKDVIRGLLPDLTLAIETWITDGIDRAMNRYNRRPEPNEPDAAGDEE